MKTNLACSTWDNLDNNCDFLLTPTEMVKMREIITIEVHSFRGMDKAQRKEKFAEVKKAWDQFQDVCQAEVDPGHIADFATAIQGDGPEELSCDYMVVLSSNKYVLGYALTAKETIEYDAPTLDRLTKAPHSYKFDKDKTLNIKLLCARKRSGIGTQLVRVCENLAIHLRCASIHLTAVPTAYGFYKSIGLSPFKQANVACNPVLDEEAEKTDANKFETAILSMAEVFESSEGMADQFPIERQKGKYKKYMAGTSEARRAVLSGVLVSQVAEPERVYKWACQPTKLTQQLNIIVQNVFTHNTVHSDTIPMTKCLLHKYSSGGGGGSNGGHDSDHDTSDSDASTSQENTESGGGGGGRRTGHDSGGRRGSGYDAGNDSGGSDESTVRENIGNSDGNTIRQSAGGSHSDESTVRQSAEGSTNNSDHDVPWPRDT